MAYSLDQSQEQAAETSDGQFLIIACPGSGKTTVIIERIHRMIEKGIPQANMLVITFTKAAADEMQKRYEDKFGTSAVLFGTIHSVCFRVLRKALNLSVENILRESEQWDFFRRYLISRISQTDLEEYIRQLMTEISYVKNSRTNPAAYISNVCSSNDFVQFFYAYEDYKRERSLIDFDDMLILCRKVLIHMPQELAYWKEKFKYIMIDEFQDTNRIQADIFYMLAGKNGNIFVVGDDDQSIYGFRSADSTIMLEFQKTFPQCTKIYLDTNYRSCENIVEGAAKLIKHNQIRFEKQIRANRKDTGTIFTTCHKDSMAQALSVIENVRQMHKNGIDYNDMAVLYRTNNENQILVGSLISLKDDKIPFYTTENPKDIHNEFIYGDLMAYWRLAEGNWKDGDLQRILNRPSRFLKAEVFKDCKFVLNDMLRHCDMLEGSNRINQAKSKIFDLVMHVKKLKGKPPEEFIDYMMNVVQYKKWLSDYAAFTGKKVEDLLGILQMLKEEAKGFTSMADWDAYAQFYAKKIQELRRSKNKKGLCLSTFHSAKGLEWKAVILIDCNEGFCPYRKADTPAQYEEERRLFYVAATRAKDTLLMFYLKADAEMEKSPSRYLSEFGLMGEDAVKKKAPRHIGYFPDLAVPEKHKETQPLPAVKLTERGQKLATALRQ